ncbi:MAG: nucleotidyltransferase domain-containing protein [Candidatus Pacebacteria bacterium]|nr:nucleotidyltransferase domain-containing protein [Candidatus Paceibacterota bacterium]
MKSEIDQLIEEAKEEEKFFKNYLLWAKGIKKEVEKHIGKVKVFVFGSVLKKDQVPQDIDILIVSPKFKEPTQKTKILSILWEKLKIGDPFEIHLITPKDYKEWYRYFLDKKIEVK